MCSAPVIEFADSERSRQDGPEHVDCHLDGCVSPFVIFTLREAQAKPLKIFRSKNDFFTRRTGRKFVWTTNSCAEVGTPSRYGIEMHLSRICNLVESMNPQHVVIGPITKNPRANAKGNAPHRALVENMTEGAANIDPQSSGSI